MEQASYNHKDSFNNEYQSSKEEFYDEEKKIPKILNGKFEVKEELGKGAHGKIYLGKDKHSKMQVAIKLVIFKYNHYFTHVDG